MRIPSAASEIKDKRVFLGVQALRGVAAGMVVIHHATQFWISKIQGHTLNDGWANGTAGVDIFFVISGFVMTLSCSGSKKPSVRVFLWRRILRIMPLYWLVTILTIFKLLLGDQMSVAKSVSLSLSRFLTSMLLLPVDQPLRHISFIVPVGWTLSFEMFFYLLFSVALFYKITPVLFLTPLLLLFSFVGSYQSAAWPSIALLLSPLLLEFLAGVLIASYLQQLGKTPRPIAYLIGLASLYVLLVVPQQDGLRGFALRALSAALLVLSTALLEKQLRTFLPRLSLMIGDASYSLYLSHYLLLSLIILPWSKTQATLLFEVSYVTFSLVLAVALSLLLYRFVEAPMTRALGGWIRVGAPRVLAEERV